LRYRYHHGVNLGSVYVLEKWLTASAFPPDAPEDATSELTCVMTWVKKVGAQETQKKFEERWFKAMSEEDWKWLTWEAKATTIRLPIGYFTLGPDFVKGTPFEQYGEVYKNGWATVKKFIATAHEKGVGVLVDLHALPGGANAAEHSGTNSRAIKFWDDTANLDLAVKCLVFIAKETKDLPGVIGIQVVNEAE
jgi:aryl-phospho-beta-D-glucosidase BglC (GH1 family)